MTRLSRLTPPGTRDRFRRAVRRAVFPTGWMLAAIALGAFGLLIAVFAMDMEGAPVSYVAYAASAYALAIVCARVPGAVRAVRRRFERGPLRRWLARFPLGNRYVRDAAFRAEVGLYRGLTVNLACAAVKLALGIVWRSWWFVSLAAYYGLLAAMRLLLARSRGTLRDERRRCRWCGVILLAMTQALTGIVILMVRKGEGYRYPGALIYAMAMYAFYAFGSTVANALRFRRRQSSVLSAARALDFVAAMVSMLALETAMIAEFGGGADFRRRMTAAVGGCVCAATLALAIVLIARGGARGPKGALQFGDEDV